MSWYRMNGTHWRWINVTYEGNTIIYSTRVNIVRKLPLSSMVITKQEEDSRVQHRSGPFNAWKLQKERFEAWLGRMSWGQSRSMPAQLLRKDQTHLYEGKLCPRQACHCENWLVTTCESSKWKWSYVLGLAMNMPIVSEAAPVTWSMRCWRRQWCWGCGCRRVCCWWRHANGVPGGDLACLWTSQGGGSSQLWSFMQLEIPAPQYLAKARRASASRS